MRDRIREQFTKRFNEHAAVQAELDALTADAGPAASDPALLDELPYAPGQLASAPAAIREALYAAFDIQCLYRQDQGQLTIWATITAATPGIIAALTADPRTDSDITTATDTPAPNLYADLQDAAIGDIPAHDDQSGLPWRPDDARLTGMFLPLPSRDAGQSLTADPASRFPSGHAAVTHRAASPGAVTPGLRRTANACC